MSKYTPGPWKVFRENPLLWVRDNGNIFSICYLFGHKEMEANANLIAMAPELLDALKQATAQIERDYNPTSLDGHLALIRKLNAIIIKAEGHSDSGDTT